jgi:hypothetical protein
MFYAGYIYLLKKKIGGKYMLMLMENGAEFGPKKIVK